MSPSKAPWIAVLLACLLVSASPASALPPQDRAAQSPARLPLILLPGLTGSRMLNDPDLDGRYGEVWPNGDRLILDPWDRALLDLKLAPNGAEPFTPEPRYATVIVGDIIRTEYTLDYYASTIAYFTGPAQGYVEGRDFFVCPYDWRKDIREIAYGSLPQTLDKCIQTALARNPGVSQVNLLAHSMGGLVARTYLADPARAAQVSRLVTLGTPLLGAPKIVLALLDKLCFAEWMGMCFTNTDVLHELIQNYPAGYQIAPGDAYFQVYASGYIRRDRDADGDGRLDGFLSPQAAFSLLEQHNPVLAQQAQAWYALTGGWGNGGTNGAQVLAIVGDQHASMGMIVEYEKRPWYNPWGKGAIAYRSQVTNGDGTVPLRSADTLDRARSIDLSGGVPVLYFNLEHGQLPKDPAVLQLVSGFFDGAALDDADLLAPGQAVPAGASAPRSEPIPLDGTWITVDGPVKVEVVDQAGSKVGRPTPTASVQAGIQSASYTEMGETTFTFLPPGGPYSIRIHGQQAAFASVRIQRIQADQVAQTDWYAGVPVTAQSNATLAFDPAASQPGEFALDQDGDGRPEGSFAPTAVLNAQESLDHTPPTTTVTVQGTLAPGGGYVGPVTVTLASVDNPGGAGVLKIEYSLDGGQTAQVYSAPFQVDPQAVSQVLARSTDRAGNEEWPLASARLSQERLFIPSIYYR